MKQYAVIGLGRFGSSVARVLSEHNRQVMVIDIEESRIKELKGIAAHSVCADATDKDMLKEVDIENIDTAIVSVGDNIEASMLITLALKELGVKEIIVKAVTDEQAIVLEKIGASRIVFPEREMGRALAESLIL